MLAQPSAQSAAEELARQTTSSCRRQRGPARAHGVGGWVDWHLPFQADSWPISDAAKRSSHDLAVPASW